jgi:hypothetical protein
MFLMLFLVAFLCATLQVLLYRSSAQYLEDALAASNLASAVIDIEEYGKTHVIRIGDTKQAHERFLCALKENLHLDENWECTNRLLFSGPIQMEMYIVYNVRGNEVEVSRFDREGRESRWVETLGRAKAPNGKVIQSSSIYSAVSYHVSGIFDTYVAGYKDNLADVVRNAP